MLKRLRGPDGEQLVLEENFFVEKIFTAGVMRDIDDETMTEIRRPYARSWRGAPCHIDLAAANTDRRRTGKDVAELVEGIFLRGWPATRPAETVHQRRTGPDYFRARSGDHPQLAEPDRSDACAVCTTRRRIRPTI